MKKLNFWDSVKITLACIFFLVLLFIGSVVVNTLTSLQESEEAITGEAVSIMNRNDPPQTGSSSSIQINNTNQNNTSVEVPVQVPPPPVITDPVLRCWAQGGITGEDILVVGNLLGSIPCPEAEKQDLQSKKENGCIIVNIGEEGSTTLCAQDKTPNISISLSNNKPAFINSPSAVVKVPEKNRSWYLLYPLGLLVLIYFWRIYEVDFRAEREIRKEHKAIERKKAMEERQKEREEKKAAAKEILSAPSFIEKKKEEKPPEDPKDVVKKKRDKTLKEFHTLADEINTLIIKGKSKESKDKYLKLFDIYSTLLNLLDKKQQETINSVMEYLCNYLNVLETQQQEKPKNVQNIQKEMDKKEIRPKAKLLSMEELKETRELLRKKHYAEAQQVFYPQTLERLHPQRAVRNAVVRRDSEEMQQIEIRHQKLLQKGAVPVAEEDYYRFMQDLHKLRKQLNRNIVEKKEKKKG